MEQDLTVTLLGRLSVTRHPGQRASAPTAPKERKILALLLLAQGRTVPISTLAEELWAAAPPRRVAASLQTYVLNIRGRLSRELALPGSWVRDRLVVTSNEGYRFRTDDCHLDLAEYTRLADLGEAAAERGDTEDAVRLLRAAENLWCGPVLPDLEHGLPLRAESVRLEQRQLAVQESRIEGELRLGRHRQLVSELSMLTLRHPYHERFHEYLMLALCACGRTVQALEVYQRLRQSLVGGIGIEPSARIRRLHEDVLCARVPESAAPGDS
ncbi:AfsR/SARP family transcriptional regulator [Streptomyces roseirectus]|uniref:AfsR/SARP family transcriptional regulator n=1 Tax=Streptomyces roseirectus TaxID=2768066 RepID=A0A7H0IPZ7_9ACTN|nr:AfsR/SARP family transcriptional regulator [Streptomyces roseirectus]QNP74863.1 AfsR/SARP family transcriptional regulator [Streptomyces roseirectus]